MCIPQYICDYIVNFNDETIKEEPLTKTIKCAILTIIKSNHI